MQELVDNLSIYHFKRKNGRTWNWDDLYLYLLIPQNIPDILISKGKNGRTVLHSAVKHEKVALAILRHHKDILDIKDGNGRMLLHPLLSLHERCALEYLKHLDGSVLLQSFLLQEDNKRCTPEHCMAIHPKSALAMLKMSNKSTSINGKIQDIKITFYDSENPENALDLILKHKNCALWITDNRCDMLLLNITGNEG